MATSTNYGWSEPDNTSLVKDGAQAIRTLGDAIDTSVWNIGFGQAGKNKIINGDFGIWQRGTSFSANGYTADRWTVNFSGATGTVSQQTFTPGTAPVAGYEGTFFLRYATTVADDNSRIEQKIENVRTFAGQTVTISLWAKADSARTITLNPYQSFGSGGSADVSITGQTISVTTSWTRFTKTFSIPSVSGKTIGTGSFLSLELLHAPNATFTLDIWGVQVEYGSKATPFQTASGGSPQAELAMCQRYFYNHATGATQAIGVGYNETSTSMGAQVKFAVTMRVAPSLVVVTGTNYYQFYRNGGTDDFNSFTLGAVSTNAAAIYNNSEISGTAGQAGNCYSNNAASSISFNAEL